MSHFLFCLVAGWLAVTASPAGAAAAAAAAAPVETAVAPEAGAEAVTVVTSERLTYDSQRQLAVFEKNVVVTDPQLQLTADMLTLRFDEKGQAESIEAVGHVRITQADKKAVAGSATYDVETGKIELKGHPQVMRGKDILQGDTITFWRDHEKLVCEPQARLVIYPQEGTREQFFGE